MSPDVERLITGVASTANQRVTRPTNKGVVAADPQRSEASRDADRILYSAAWRRLAGVTQVVTPFEGQATVHNRLTHSEKVAQVSRAVALHLLSDDSNRKLFKKLGGYSADVCEAAALAHDIGHPPFGHVGEVVLDDVARNELGLDDGFEGNAQSLRILTTRRIRDPYYEGLDLSYATLAGVAKYPWPRVARAADHEDRIKTDAEYRKHWTKFNAYDPQAALLRDVRSYLPAGYGVQTQSLEASTMDVADDITYALHDLEDAYLAGSLNVIQVVRDLQELTDNWNEPEPADNMFAKGMDRLRREYPATWFNETQYLRALRKAISLLSLAFSSRSRPRNDEDESNARATLSDVIGDMISHIHVHDSLLWDGGPYLGLDQAEWHDIQVLKEITRSYVIREPDLAILQIGQQTIIRELVEMLQLWRKRDPERLPRALREGLSVAEDLVNDPSREGYGRGKYAPRGKPDRAYLDFLCTLTDAQCIGLHEKLSGRRQHRSMISDGY